MTKMTSALISILLSSNLMAAEPVIIKVNTNLIDKKIIKVVNDSVASFLEYEGQEISGGLYEEITNPMIKEITKVGKKVTKLKIQSDAFYFSYDHDFGDPIDEEETVCETELIKSANGKYELKNATTTCEYVPSDNDHYDPVNSCCTPEGPIVDANWCFDSYEEGIAYCGEPDGWDEY